MKILHQKRSYAAQSGMTLIELTVVILVLLSLIVVLFVGATAWKKGTDRSGAIITIRNAQMGMRAFTQIEDIETASYSGLPEALFGQNRFVSNGTDNAGNPKANGELPDHPVKGFDFDYVAGDGDAIPELGVLYIATGGSGGVSDYTYNPNPAAYQHW